MGVTERTIISVERENINPHLSWRIN
ncbi:hypothetical protein [Lactobacillus helsingborgensis]|nr:hypothetical protein [Lactobacillus helsingborgensis]